MQFFLLLVRESTVLVTAVSCKKNVSTPVLGGWVGGCVGVGVCVCVCVWVWVCACVHVCVCMCVCVSVSVRELVL